MLWTVVLEKTLESPLDCKEIQPVHPKGDQSWVFIGRTNVEAETPVLWPSDAKSWLIWKDPDAGKDWGEEQKGKTEEEMVGWHHRLNGHGFGWTPGVDDGQGGLVCCSSWGHKESDTTERLNWTSITNTCKTVFCQTVACPPRQYPTQPLWASASRPGSRIQPYPPSKNETKDKIGFPPKLPAHMISRPS